MLILFILLSVSQLHAGERKFVQIRNISAPEARQGIAVDAGHFYVIGSRQTGKYEKKSAKRVKHWQEKPDGPIIHLDSGVIVNDKLSVRIQIIQEFQSK